MNHFYSLAQVELRRLQPVGPLNPVEVGPTAAELALQDELDVAAEQAWSVHISDDSSASLSLDPFRAPQSPDLEAALNGFWGCNGSGTAEPVLGPKIWDFSSDSVDVQELSGAGARHGSDSLAFGNGAQQPAAVAGPAPTEQCNGHGEGAAHRSHHELSSFKVPPALRRKFGLVDEDDAQPSGLESEGAVGEVFRCPGESSSALGPNAKEPLVGAKGHALNSDSQRALANSTLSWKRLPSHQSQGDISRGDVAPRARSGDSAPQECPLRTRGTLPALLCSPFTSTSGGQGDKGSPRKKSPAKRRGGGSRLRVTSLDSPADRSSNISAGENKAASALVPCTEDGHGQSHRTGASSAAVSQRVSPCFEEEASARRAKELVQQPEPARDELTSGKEGSLHRDTSSEELSRPGKVPRSLRGTRDALFTPGTEPFHDSSFQKQLVSQLGQLATAYSTCQEDSARALLARLSKAAAPNGVFTQRLVYYMLSALVERFEKKNPLTPRAIPLPEITQEQAEEARESVANAWGWLVQGALNIPLKKALVGNPKVHIIVLSTCTTPDWSDLFQALADQPEKPSVRVSMVVPGAGAALLPQIQKEYDFTVSQMALAAARCGLDVVYSKRILAPICWGGNLVPVDPEEAVGVVTWTTLQMLPDETVLRHNPRDAVLKWLRGLRPRVFCAMELDASLNTPFFLARFGEAVRMACTLLEYVDYSVRSYSEIAAGGALEQHLSLDLINAVQQEGLERFGRAESLKKWRDRFKYLGFAECAFSAESLAAFGTAPRRRGLSVETADGFLSVRRLGSPMFFAGCWTCEASEDA